MKTWFLSDIHGNHDLLNVPEVDTIIIAGDVTNYKELYKNEQEFFLFKNWLFNLSIKNKILIAGNHDAWATKKYNIDDLKANGVMYLEHEYVEVENKLIFGSPYTPTFGNWYFNVHRNKLQRYWEVLEGSIHILVTHGPPKGILDLTLNREDKLEMCGDKALLNKVLELRPKIHVFGHIHNFKQCINQGIREYQGIKFINASIVEDGKFGNITNNGIIIDI